VQDCENCALKVKGFFCFFHRIFNSIIETGKDNLHRIVHRGEKREGFPDSNSTGFIGRVPINTATDSWKSNGM
jgi:hypothetical protein